MGYVAFGDDDKPGDLTPQVSKGEGDSGSGFFKRMGRAISPKNTRSGRRSLSPRSFVGPLSPEKKKPSISKIPRLLAYAYGT